MPIDPEFLMQKAIDVCRKGIAAGQSPFGALVATLDGKIVVASHNTVRATCDSTAHAEINAIRDACKKLGTIDLTGHALFTTCEPCPMCAAAIHWARLDSVYYGATIADAAEAGFHELTLACKEIYRLGESSVGLYPRILQQPCAALFQEWRSGPRPEPY